MKIKALRLAEVGPFQTPIAVESFSGGLDVLMGPNETGKSTLFAALGVLLGERHTTTARHVAALRPYAGGAPLIEADLDIGSRRVRLTKRYLAQRTAELVDLRSGEVWRGADAETAIDGMFGGEDRRMLRNFLSVAQGAGFELPEKPEAALSSGLAKLIEMEAADAAAAGDIRILLDAVKGRLDALVTSRTGKTKAGGPLDKALRLRDDIVRRLEAQREKAAQAERRIARRSELVAERERLFDPAHKAELATRHANASKAVADANKARDQLRLAEERVASRQMALDRAKGLLKQHVAAREEAARLSASVKHSRAQLQALAAQRDEATVRQSSLETMLEQAEASVQGAREELRLAHAAAERRACEARLADVDAQLVLAREATEAIAFEEKRLRGLKADEAGIERVRELVSRIAVLEGQIAAETTRATINYLPGVASRLRICGAAVDDGQVLTIDRRMEITIDGVGTLVVEPGRSSGAEAVAEKLEVTRELDALLADMDVPDPAAAQRAFAARQQASAAVAEHRSKLSAIAPGGVEDLQERRKTLATRLGSFAYDLPEIAAVPDVVQGRIREVDALIESRRRELVACQHEVGELQTRITRLEAQVEAEEKRLTELNAGRTDRDIETLGRCLEADVGLADAALLEVVRERSAWADSAPDAARYEALVAAARQVATDLASVAEGQGRLERELAELEGAMRRDNEDGVGAEIAGLEEELAAAAQRVAELQVDVDALNLLATRLEHIGEDHRSLVLRPLVARLEPLLGELFTGARLHMDGPLLAVKLERGDREDPLPRVSGGTREQIATIVRIAYADLLAANGMELPLILDDALVFSDDRRLEIVVGLLAAAAERHQVVMLSCHQRSLQPLFAAKGANQLQLSDWQDGLARLGGGTGVKQKSRTISAAPSLVG